jgi:ubiquinone/menaquinone biosynthesis C-methylase UbiE
VIYVASLQFVDDYEKALERTAKVLSSNGRLILMLLNERAEFVKQKSLDPNSYMSKIKHKDIKKIISATSSFFSLEIEYLIGLKNGHPCDYRKNDALLCVVNGIKKIQN